MKLTPLYIVVVLIVVRQNTARFARRTGVSAQYACMRNLVAHT